MEFQYDDPEFGECSEFCGGGLQTRSLSCLRVTTDGGITTNVTVAEENCIDAGVQRPPSVQQCNNRPCPIYDIGRYSEVCL